jgi:hypothetical protein
VPTLVIGFCRPIGRDRRHVLAIHHAEERRQDASLLATSAESACRDADDACVAGAERYYGIVEHALSYVAEYKAMNRRAMASPMPLAPPLINTVRISVLEVVVDSVVIRGRTLVFLDDVAAVDNQGLAVDVACFG